MRSCRLIAVALMALMVASCKTQQKAVENTVTDVRETTIENHSTSESQTTTLLEDEDLEVDLEVTEWSEPDSLGNQHPKKTTKAKAKRRKASDQNAVQTRDEHRSNTVQKKEQKNEKREKETTVTDAGYDGTMTIIFVMAIVTAVIIYIRKR